MSYFGIWLVIGFMVRGLGTGLAFMVRDMVSCSNSVVFP